MEFRCSKCAARVDLDWRFCVECGALLPVKTYRRLVLVGAEFAAGRQRNWREFQQNQDIIQAAQILAPPDACDACRKENGRVVSTDRPSPLPHSDCTCYPWCRCTLIPMTKQLIRRMEKTARGYEF